MTTPSATCRCDSNKRLTAINEPSGETVTFAYDANGERDQKTVTTGGSSPTTTQVNDAYQNGRLASQTNQAGTLLVTFTYDPNGIPESVVVGTDPVHGPRYFYAWLASCWQHD